jgi:hypothetical protein
MLQLIFEEETSTYAQVIEYLVQTLEDEEAEKASQSIPLELNIT